MSDYTIPYDAFKNSYICFNFQISFKRNRTTFAVANGVFKAHGTCLVIGNIVCPAEGG